MPKTDQLREAIERTAKFTQNGPDQRDFQWIRISGIHAHERIQDVYLHLAAGITFQMGGICDWNCGRRLLVRIFRPVYFPDSIIFSAVSLIYPTYVWWKQT